MTDFTTLDRYCAAQGIACMSGVALSEHCSFKIGGPAQRLVQPGSDAALSGLLALLSEESLPRLILGKGSNLLFSDEGFAGVVVQLGAAFAVCRMQGEELVACDSGASLTQLCRFACDQGLSGLEFAYGIPGSVGGAIYMNAGAYGGEIKDVLVLARHLEPDGKMGTLSGPELQFGYRHSAYTDSARVITGGIFRLRKSRPADILALMEEYMRRRREKQPLEYPSAGSTFKRPSGAYASALIDQCGLKGMRVGGAMVSEKHAGFIVNVGGATGAQIRELIARVQTIVQEKTGYRLDCEVKMID